MCRIVGYQWLLGAVSGITLLAAACTPVEEYKARRQFDKAVQAQPHHPAAREARQPFGCDSRDLANFTCE